MEWNGMVWYGIACMVCMLCMVCRRKFRSQTSDNMDRWKAEQGRVREKRKIRREKSRRERVRRKKMQMREKVGKSRNTVFFQWFVAPEGRKVGSLKRASWPDERWKIARRCGAKHISKSKCTNTRGADHFWQLRCRKSARRCGAKHISKWKWRFRCRFAWQAQGIVYLVKSDQNVRVFAAFPRMMAGMGHLKRICKDAFSWQAQYKRHVHERC